jgi:hypothetical protein
LVPLWGVGLGSLPSPSPLGSVGGCHFYSFSRLARASTVSGLVPHRAVRGGRDRASVAGSRWQNPPPPPPPNPQPPPGVFLARPSPGTPVMSRSAVPLCPRLPATHPSCGRGPYGPLSPRMGAGRGWAGAVSARERSRIRIPRRAPLPRCSQPPESPSLHWRSDGPRPCPVAPSRLPVRPTPQWVPVDVPTRPPCLPRLQGGGCRHPCGPRSPSVGRPSSASRPNWQL